MGRTRMANIRKETYDVCIGRAGCDKNDYFGSPFRLEATMAKGSTLGQYKKYFYHRLSADKEFRKRIGNLQGETLGCFCRPDPCHGDVTREYLDRMAENVNETIVIGQAHWKGCVYPIREIGAGSHIFRVSMEGPWNELANDTRSGIYETVEANEEIDGYCTDEELYTLSGIGLYKMYC